MDSLDEAGKRRVLSAEHVIPRAILRLCPPSDRDNWPIVLDVHRACEEQQKTGRDHLAKLLQVLGGQGIQGWTWQEFEQFRSKCDIKIMDVGGILTPVMEGIQDAILAAFLWVRGLHAALYHEVLPPTVGQWTACPAPGFRSEGGDPQAQFDHGNACARGALSVVIRSIAAGKFDRVVLCGGAIEYRCAWLHYVDEDDPSTPWCCCWALDLPGSQKWALEVRGRDMPWHGMYAVENKPEGASWSTISELMGSATGSPPTETGPQGDKP